MMSVPAQAVLVAQVVRLGKGCRYVYCIKCRSRDVKIFRTYVDFGRGQQNRSGKLYKIQQCLVICIYILSIVAVVVRYFLRSLLRDFRTFTQ